MFYLLLSTGSWHIHRFNNVLDFDPLWFQQQEEEEFREETGMSRGP